MFKTRQKTDYMLLRRLTELHKTLQIISEVIPAEGNAVFSEFIDNVFLLKTSSLTELRPRAVQLSVTVRINVVEFSLKIKRSIWVSVPTISPLFVNIHTPEITNVMKTVMLFIRWNKKDDMSGSAVLSLISCCSVVKPSIMSPTVINPAPTWPTMQRGHRVTSLEAVYLSRKLISTSWYSRLPV